jgi:predicted amidohydrolase YtcJ
MTEQIQNIDILIRNAKVFNNGEMPIIEDVAVSEGRIVARGLNLNEANASRVVDAEGLWLMPGLFDIHTL